MSRGETLKFCRREWYTWYGVKSWGALKPNLAALDEEVLILFAVR
jgi:hypothetical protein